MRAGDADRDATLAVIQDAFANGRLTPVEAAERQDRALSSQFTDELYPIVSDLPEGATLPQQLSVVHGHANPKPVPAHDMEGPNFAILSGKTYDLVPGQTSVRTVAVLGGDTIHTKDAFGPGVTVTMHIDAVLGGNTIFVPSGVRVIDQGEAIMGGNSVSKRARGDGSNGVLILRGTCFLGGSEVKLERSSR